MHSMAEIDALLRAQVRTWPPSNGRPASPSNLRRAAWRFVHRRKIWRRRLPHPNRVRRECLRAVRAELRTEFRGAVIGADFARRASAISAVVIQRHMGLCWAREAFHVYASEAGFEIEVGP